MIVVCNFYCILRVFDATILSKKTGKKSTIVTKLVNTKESRKELIRIITSLCSSLGNYI